MCKVNLCYVYLARHTVSVPKPSPLGHYKLDNSFPSSTRMPFIRPPNIFIIVVIFYYNKL